MRPRALDIDPRYKTLTPAAKELYTKILSRRSLSATKGDEFRDDRGVYVYYTLAQACEQLNCKRDKAMSVFKELEKAGLIARRRVGYSNPYRIYVTDLLQPSDTATNNLPESPTDNGREDRPIEVGDPAAISVDGSDPSYTDISNTELSHTDSSTDPNWTEVESRIKAQISYDILLQDIPADLLNGIVRTILITYCTTREYITISKTRIPIQTIRDELDALDDLHIRYVYDKLHQPREPIQNMTAYIRYLVWNARREMEVSADAEVSRDEAAGRMTDWSIPAWYYDPPEHESSVGEENSICAVRSYPLQN